MIKNFILSGLFLFTFSALPAQSHPTCGTTGDLQEQVVERLKKNIETLRTSPVQQRDVVYIPLTIHIISRDNGTGGVSKKALFDQLCEMNHTYQDMNMVFYIKQFKYMNNSIIFENHQGAGFVMNSRRDPTSINIWAVKDASPPSGSLGTTLGYYTPQYDWIIMRNDEFGLTKKTLPHEMGHFFSLAHPHRGWDDEPYDVTVHGNPVQAMSPGGIPTELQDGSNCTEAGDLVCDTPPDYNFGFGWDDCNYNAGTMDPSGTIVDPQEVNIMGYFLHCPPDSYLFTEMQKALMLTDYNSAHRAYLRTDNPTPIHDEITDGPTLTYPVSGESTAYYNEVNFEWETVPGATYYYLEVANNVAFNPSLPYEAFVVYGNTKVVSGFFSANKTYYWRVKAMNPVRTCEGLSSVANFRSGLSTATNGIEAINELNIFPNPASNIDHITIQVKANNTFTSSIQLFDITGKQVGDSFQHEFILGKSEFNLPINNLESGVYNLSIVSNQKAIAKKIIVIK